MERQQALAMAQAQAEQEADDLLMRDLEQEEEAPAKKSQSYPPASHLEIPEEGLEEFLDDEEEDIIAAALASQEFSRSMEEDE